MVSDSGHGRGRRQVRPIGRVVGRDVVGGSALALVLIVSLAVVAAACLPSGQGRRIGVPTSRRTVASVVVPTTLPPANLPSSNLPSTNLPSSNLPSSNLPSTVVPPTVPPPVSELPPSSRIDACAAIRNAASGATVVIPAGIWAIGDCRVDGRGRSDVVVRSEFAADPTGVGGPAGRASVLVGALNCSDCDRWRFDGISVRGDGSLVDPAYVVAMSRGTGWRWTNCEIFNGLDESGRRYGVRGLFNVWEWARDWRIDECWIHSNGSSRPTVADNNYDHLLYINGFSTSISANGQVGPGNVFEQNRWGAPVKVGFGVNSLNLPVGVRGVRLVDNLLRYNSSPDGNCGILVSGDSPDTVIERNRIDCTDLPAATTLNPVLLWAWPLGARVHIEGNTLIGGGGAGTPTDCGSRTHVRPHDRSILVLQWFPNWWVTAGASGCQFRGLTTVDNVVVPG